MTVYEVPEQNFGWLKEKVEALNKRAEKLGVEPIRMTVIAETIKQTLDRRVRDAVEASLVAIDGWNGSYLMVKFLTIEVIGEAPVLAGWRFIGTIQHVQDNGDSATILRAVPGQKIPDQYRDADPRWCDQCRTKQLRNDTFVVQSVETTETKRVGRNCLKDFIGHPKPEMYADWAEKLSLLDDLFKAACHETSEGRLDDRYFPTEVYLAVVTETIARWGWTSGKMARDAEERGEHRTRTRDIATEWFINSTDDRSVWRDIKVSQASVDRAKEALAWARDESGLLGLVVRKPDNDYLYNLKEVSKLDALNYRMLGIAASLIPAWERETRGPEPKTSTSTHFGTVGVRTTTIFKLIEKRNFMSSYSGESMTILRFETPEGDIAVWFTGGDHGMKQGATYRVKATIKRHDEYKGLRQTVVNRVVVMEELK